MNSRLINRIYLILLAFNLGGCELPARKTPMRDHNALSPGEKYAGQFASEALIEKNKGKILPYEKSTMFSADELKAANLVREHIERQSGKKFDGRYHVAKSGNDYSVTVYYVSSYWEGQPLIAPGMFGGYEASLSTMNVKLVHHGM
jgi:hypothetical protein